MCNGWCDVEEGLEPDLADDLANLPKVGTPTQTAARQEVLYESRTNVVSHLIKLLVYFAIVFIVLNELHNERAVREREKLCIL